jgi:hypothetical protein
MVCEAPESCATDVPDELAARDTQSAARIFAKISVPFRVSVGNMMGMQEWMPTHGP